MSENRCRIWMCVVCGWIHNEAVDAPEDGLASGARWEDILDTWVCPDCGANKGDFEIMEI